MPANKLSRLPIPPHSVEAEQAVLGSLMMDVNAWPRIERLVSAGDFYRPDHRQIFAAIAQLRGEGKAADAVTVAEHLGRRGTVEQVGGLSYLGLLTRDTPTSSNVETYAAIVRERSIKRRLRDTGEQILRTVQESPERGVVDLIADAEEQILRLHERARTGRGLIDSGQLVGALIDDLDRRREGARGLSVGLPDFDDLTCGLEPGDLVVIAGRPGMGKTALLVSIAAVVSEHTPVAVFSAEMPAHQLMRRCVAFLGRIPHGRLRRAERLTDQDWLRISESATAIAARRLFIDDTTLPPLTHVRAECLALKAREPLGLVIVDYVQLMRGKGDNRYEQLREVSYGLKALAKDLGVPIIVLAQLNRDVEKRERKRPNLSDLRDSGAIEEAADIVGLLYSEGYYDRDFTMPNVLECAITKNRNGERGECLWHFAGEYSRVVALEQDTRAQYQRLREASQPRARGNPM